MFLIVPTCTYPCSVTNGAQVVRYETQNSIIWLPIKKYALCYAGRRLYNIEHIKVKQLCKIQKNCWCL